MAGKMGLSKTYLSAVAVMFVAILGFYVRHQTGLSLYDLAPSLAASPTALDAARNVTYRGIKSSKVEHFNNIFFAQDTSGLNRFAPPKPLVQKNVVIDATSNGAWCPQGLGDVLPFTSKVENISEDCLSLRIVRPGGTKPQDKLPVAVWIHGGKWLLPDELRRGHALGSGAEKLYHADGLVEQAVSNGQPIIFVAINYRLGIFGFARSEALDALGHTNAGLRDQRAALEWIQQNIAHFGGDPEKVTAIGQSVGASDIGLQLLAYGGRDKLPFQQAHMVSGSPGLLFNIESDLVANSTSQIASELGCVENGKPQSQETLDCLRSVPSERLANVSVAASRAARPPFGEGWFYPTLDGDFIQDRPSVATRAGKFASKIPLLLSWVSNEGAWYAPPTTDSTESVQASFGLWMFNLSESTLAKLMELYPLSDFEHMVRPDIDGPISPQYYRAAQLNRDLWFTCPALDFAWQYAQHSDLGKVWLYEHNATKFGPAYDLMGVPMWRAAHLSDIPYIMNGDVHPGDNSKEQRDLSAVLSSNLVDFVRSGTPGTRGLSGWAPAFDRVKGAERISLALFGGPHGSKPVTVEADGVAADDAEAAVYAEKLFERCRFINSEKVRAEAGV